MRIRTVETLQALRQQETGGEPVTRDSSASLQQAIETFQNRSPTESRRRPNIALETAVTLLHNETVERGFSEQAAQRNERQFQQLFTASRLPIAIYDLSAVLMFLKSLEVPAGKSISSLVGARPDLSGQVLHRLQALQRNAAMESHFVAQGLQDEISLLDNLAVSSIESFIEAVLAIDAGEAHHECHVSLDFDTRIHQFHLAIIPLSGHEQDLDRVMLIFTPISITHIDSRSEVKGMREIRKKMAAGEKNASAFIVFRPDGTVMEVSDAAARALGLGHVRGLDVTQLFVAPEETERFRGLLKQAEAAPGQIVESRQQVECLCANGKKLWITYSLSCLEKDENFVLLLNDVSASHRLLEHIRYQNTRDVLTGLYNRREFKKQLSQALDEAPDTEMRHALLVVDLDFFKVINDSLGNSAGDEFIRQVGLLLSRSVRANDIVARLDGDEFGILLKNCRGEIARRIAEAITHDIAGHKFQWNDKVLPLTASIGIVTVDNTVKSAEDCLSHADAAVYAAKESGGNRYQFYDAEHEAVARHQNQLHWFSRIHAALEGNRFVLFAQKIDPLSAQARQEGGHYELLIRMLGEKGEIIAPGEFLPAAERYNLMPLIDRWVVRHAFQWFAVHAGRSQAIGMCSINLSGASLCDEQFSEFVLRQFYEFNIPGEKICFEITETMAIQNMQKTLQFMTTMKALGCKFSLDDFGAGFSSYGHLRSLPVDFIKIDGQFVKQMANDPVDFAMVKSINELGHLMKRQTIAEFVEDDATVEKLRSLGVDFAQGYGIERPAPLGMQRKSGRKAG